MFQVTQDFRLVLIQHSLVIFLLLIGEELQMVELVLLQFLILMLIQIMD